MGQFLKALSALASLLPALFAMIRELETSGAPGADKKAAAMAFLHQLLTGASDWVNELKDAAFVQTVENVAGHVIDAAIAAFNLVGIFQKKA
jgi:hypothetical protein